MNTPQTKEGDEGIPPWTITASRKSATDGHKPNFGSHINFSLGPQLSSVKQYWV